MNLLPAIRPKQPILWIAMVALLLGVLGSQLQYSKCLGDCCAAVATTCCDTSIMPIEADTTCCGCCDGSHDASTAGNETPSPLGELRGTCSPDCCVSTSFDLELAPLDSPSDTHQVPALPYAALQTDLRPMQPRQVNRRRPFDRGPPRIDRRTALRACTVLLI